MTALCCNVGATSHSNSPIAGWIRHANVFSTLHTPIACAVADLRLASARFASFTETTGSYATDDSVVKMVDSLRQDPERYFSGLALVANFTDSERPNFESWMKQKTGLPNKTLWYIGDDSVAPTAPWYAATTVPEIGLEAIHGIDKVRVGNTWSASADLSAVFAESVTLGRVLVGPPQINKGISLSPGNPYVAVVAPILADPANLSPQWTVNLPAGWNANTTKELPIIQCKTGGLCTVTTGRNSSDPRVGFTGVMRAVDVPMYGPTNASTGTAVTPICPFENGVTPCEAPGTNRHARMIMGRYKMWHAGWTVAPLYGDSIAIGTLARLQSRRYVMAAEDVTGQDGFHFDYTSGTPDAMIAASPATSYAMATRLLGRAPTTQASTDVAQSQSMEFIFTNSSGSSGGSRVRLTTNLHAPTPWRYEGTAFGSGSFLFALDPRPDANETSSCDVDPPFSICPPKLTPRQYKRLTQASRFKSAYVFQAGNRMWHVEVAAPSGFAVDHTVSTFVLVGGVLITLTLTALAIGALWVREEKLKHVQMDAAGKAHELTVAFACHELRNPLHALSGATGLLADDIAELKAVAMVQAANAPAGSPHARAHELVSHVVQLQEDVSTINGSCEQLHQVVNDFTDLQRLRSGRFELQPRPFEVRPLLVRCSQLHAPMARVPFMCAIDPAVQEVAWLDPVRITQILSNGLTNACKHAVTPGADIRVFAWTEPFIEHAADGDGHAGLIQQQQARAQAMMHAVMGPPSILLLNGDSATPAAAPPDMSSFRTDLSAVPVSAWYAGRAPGPAAEREAFGDTASGKASEGRGMFGLRRRRARKAQSDAQAASASSTSSSALSSTTGGRGSAAPVNGVDGWKRCWMVLEISDSGPGLQGKTGETLFEPFVQGKTTAVPVPRNKAAGNKRGATVTPTSASAAPSAGPSVGDCDPQSAGQCSGTASSTATEGGSSGNSPGAGSRAAVAGSGLGLSLTASLVRAMGGQVGLAEHDGRTRFIVRFPTYTRTAAQQAAAEGPAQRLVPYASEVAAEELAAAAAAAAGGAGSGTPGTGDGYGTRDAVDGVDGSHEEPVGASMLLLAGTRRVRYPTGAAAAAAGAGAAQGAMMEMPGYSQRGEARQARVQGASSSRGDHVAIHVGADRDRVQPSSSTSSSLAAAHVLVLSLAATSFPPPSTSTWASPTSALSPSGSATSASPLFRGPNTRGRRDGDRAQESHGSTPGTADPTASGGGQSRVSEAPVRRPSLLSMLQRQQVHRAAASAAASAAAAAGDTISNGGNEGSTRTSAVPAVADWAASAPSRALATVATSSPSAFSATSFNSAMSPAAAAAGGGTRAHVLLPPVRSPTNAATAASRHAPLSTSMSALTFGSSRGTIGTAAAGASADPGFVSADTPVVHQGSDGAGDDRDGGHDGGDAGAAAAGAEVAAAGARSTSTSRRESGRLLPRRSTTEPLHHDESERTFGDGGQDGDGGVHLAASSSAVLTAATLGPARSPWSDRSGTTGLSPGFASGGGALGHASLAIRGRRPSAQSADSSRSVLLATPRYITQARVLAVDDDHTNRRLVQRMLAKAGCECVVLEDGDQVAASLVSTGQLDPSRAAAAGLIVGPRTPLPESPSKAPRPYDIILLDIVMVRSDGVDICRRLKLAGVSVPILAMTANTSERDVIEYRAAGFDKEVTTVGKPFDVGVLAQAVSRCVKRGTA